MNGDAIMENLALKVRLAVLWLFVAVTMSANTLLYLIILFSLKGFTIRSFMLQYTKEISSSEVLTQHLFIF